MFREPVLEVSRPQSWILLGWSAPAGSFADAAPGVADPGNLSFAWGSRAKASPEPPRLTGRCQRGTVCSPYEAMRLVNQWLDCFAVLPRVWMGSQGFPQENLDSGSGEGEPAG